MNLILLAMCLGTLAYLGGRHRLARTLPPVAFFALGTLIGPAGFGLFKLGQVIALRPLALFCVAWIGFIIGTQAELRLWRKIGFNIPRLAIGISALAGLMAAVPVMVVFLITGHGVIASIAASLVMAAAGAPTALTNLAKGRFIRLGKACSGLDDFAALALAALPFLLIGSDGQVHEVSRIFRDLGFMTIAGLSLGFAMMLLVSVRAHLDERLTICLGIVSLIAGVSADLGLAPFVVAGLSGVALINTRFRAKETIYQVFVDAERPVGLFVLLYAGMLIPNLNWVAIALGISWATFRILGRYWAIKVFRAPATLFFFSLSIGAAAPVVVVAYELLTQSAGFLLQVALIGWMATEVTVIWLETHKRFTEPPT